MNRTDPTFRALHALDPASRTGLDPDQQARADATLARILASDPAADPTPEPAAAARSRRRTRLLLVPAGVVAAAAASVVVLPGLLGDTGAYAGWTPTPTSLSPQATQAAASSCLDGTGAGGEARPVLAESRGEWTYVLLRTVDGETACLLPDELVGEPLDDPTRFFARVDSERLPAVGPDRITEDGSGTGVTDGDDTFTWVEGRVGTGVETVTVTLESGQEVQASVGNGHYAAWWPAGDADETHGMTEAFTVEGRLADGTVVAPRNG